MHRALYWGHLQAAALLLEAGAQLHITDNKVTHNLRSNIHISCSKTNSTSAAQNRAWSSSCPSNA